MCSTDRDFEGIREAGWEGLQNLLSEQGSESAILNTTKIDRSDRSFWDLARATVTFNPGPDSYPVWPPDGRRLLFASAPAGVVFALVWQSADGTRVVFTIPSFSWPRPAQSPMPRR
jgi:hypothetical protein